MFRVSLRVWMIACSKSINLVKIFFVEMGKQVQANIKRPKKKKFAKWCKKVEKKNIWVCGVQKGNYHSQALWKCVILANTQTLVLKYFPLIIQQFQRFFDTKMHRFFCCCTFFSSLEIILTSRLICFAMHLALSSIFNYTESY